MKHLHALTAAFVLSLGFAAVALAESYSAQPIDGIVSRIKDGDTVVFRPKTRIDAEKGISVRMVGIDTPESHLYVPGGVMRQYPWGEQATAELARRLPLDEPLVIESLGYEQNDRMLGRIIFNDRDINYDMVLSGWAIPYIICSGKSCDEDFLEREHVGHYFKACDAARKAGRGIFNPEKPLKEMPFEFRLRAAKRRPDKFVGDFDTGRLYRPNEYKKIDLCRRVFFWKEEDAIRIGFKPTY